MGAITARVLSFQEGLRVYPEVDLIRLVSEHYTLLILKDYMPLIGELEGKVEIVRGENKTLFEGISGFYMHSGNEFELLITGDDDVG